MAGNADAFLFDPSAAVPARFPRQLSLPSQL